TGTVTVATFSDANPGDHTSDFTVTIHWGDSSSSPGTVSFAGGVYSVTGSHTYADEGSFTVAVDIADIGGASTSASLSATVADAALTATAGADISATEGASTGTVTVANFSHANPGDHTADFTATINWGDGSPTSSGAITYDAVSGSYTVTGSHTYGEEGTFAVSVSIVDDGGSTASAGLTATVADAALSATPGAPISATEGASTGTVTAATLSDANPGDHTSDFTDTIHWGDSSSSPGTVSFAGGVYSVTGSHTYGEEGTFAVSVSIVDDGGSTVSAGLTATVADAALSATPGAPISATEGASTGTITVATFSDANPGDHTSDFTAIGSAHD